MPTSHLPSYRELAMCVGIFESFFHYSIVFDHFSARTPCPSVHPKCASRRAQQRQEPFVQATHPAGPGARLSEKPAKKSNPNQNVTNRLRIIDAAYIVAFSPQQEETFLPVSK